MGAPLASKDSQETLKLLVRALQRINFRAGCSKEDNQRRLFADARDFPFIQLNPRNWVRIIAVDVDREDAAELLHHPAVPPPHAIIRNPANGHAQGFWVLADPVWVGDNAVPSHLEFLNSVTNALRNLTYGDPAFRGFIARNPVATEPAGDVYFSGRGHGYRLGELERHMKDYRDPWEDWSAWAPGTPWSPRTQAQTDMATGRNNATFYPVRRRLWLDLIDKGLQPSVDRALSYAQEINSSFPVPMATSEVVGIARSADRQVRQGKGRPGNGCGWDKSEWHARKGRHGGRQTSERKALSARENAEKGRQRIAARVDLSVRRAGRLRRRGHTYRAIADVMGASLSTAKRHVKRYSELRASLFQAGQLGTLFPGVRREATGSPAVCPTPIPTPGGTDEHPRRPAPRSSRPPD